MAEAPGAAPDADELFRRVNAANDHDGVPEWDLLQWLHGELDRSLGKPFELEPFGSFVTNLGLSCEGEGGLSDLDVVLLLRGEGADTVQSKDIRRRVVDPTIDMLGRWLRGQRGVRVTNVIRKARVPIVMFENNKLSVDVSVQQPFGVLNSWHVRDLCDSGWPGRLRGLARLAKQWAKSKHIHSAKDGCLSSYGYVMLVASFLQDAGAVPVLMEERDPEGGRFVDADDALRQVLDCCHGLGGSTGSRPPLWRAPEPLEPAESASPLAAAGPVELFGRWLEWLEEVVLPCAGPSAPLEDRHLVSVRGRTQAALRDDVRSSVKSADHWSPAASAVHLLIEEPFNGENVARCVKAEGFSAIASEVERARLFLADLRPGEDGTADFQKLLALPPLRQRAPARAAQPPKRPLEGAPTMHAPPQKRHAGAGAWAASAPPPQWSWPGRGAEAWAGGWVQPAAAQRSPQAPAWVPTALAAAGAQWGPPRGGGAEWGSGSSRGYGAAAPQWRGRDRYQPW